MSAETDECDRMVMVREIRRAAEFVLLGLAKSARKADYREMIDTLDEYKRDCVRSDEIFK